MGPRKQQLFYELVSQTDVQTLIHGGYEPPNCRPAKTFDSVEEYISYFEPLILAELRAEFASTVDKFIRDGGERGAFRLQKTAERNDDQQNQGGKRREDGGVAMRARLLWSSSESFGSNFELQPTFNPNGAQAYDGDAVVIWHFDPITKRNKQEPVPRSAFVGVVERTTGQGTAIVRSSRARSTLQVRDGKEVVLFKLGGYVTYQRERDALYRLRRSLLTEDVLNPPLEPEVVAASTFTPNNAQFVEMVVERNGLNASQANAIMSAVKTSRGFRIIQGPPGTGKTRTLVALLNVVHMTEYQLYYESFLRSIQVNVPSAETQSAPSRDSSDVLNSVDSSKGKTGLQSMLDSLEQTLSYVPKKRHRRPRLLVCTPSNAAVDEALTRVANEGFIDASGRKYNPELARIGARDVIAESARFVSGEGQADAFLERALGPYSGKGPHSGDPAIKRQWLTEWQMRGDALFAELGRTKRSAATAPLLVDIHEQLERLDRDMRRFEIASSKMLKREEKLRRIEKTYIEEAQLVFATLSGVSTLLSALGGEDVLFETLVIDEAAQATEPSSIIPFMFGVKRCMLVGDPQQLPATVFSSGSTKASYGQSLLERLVRVGLPVLLLDTQYRMHPAISSFPSRHFYKSKLRNGECVEGDGRRRPYHEDEHRPGLGPYVFFDVHGGSEKRGQGERSLHNAAEAEIAVSLVKRLCEKYGETFQRSSIDCKGIGIVTPYKRQLTVLRRALKKAEMDRFGVEIDTVDAYQGREKDVIIFSCVRTAVDRGIGFVRDVRRLNVGITRARCSMIILGSAAALSSGSKDWAALIEDAESRGLLYRVGQTPTGLLPTRDMSWLSGAIDSSLLAGSASDREAFSDSVNSESESNSRRDPRKRVKSESLLQQTFNSASEPEPARPKRVDPRLRADYAKNASKPPMPVYYESAKGTAKAPSPTATRKPAAGASALLGSALNRYLESQGRRRKDVDSAERETHDSVPVAPRNVGSGGASDRLSHQVQDGAQRPLTSSPLQENFSPLQESVGGGTPGVERGDRSADPLPDAQSAVLSAICTQLGPLLGNPPDLQKLSTAADLRTLSPQVQAMLSAHGGSASTQPGGPTLAPSARPQDIPQTQAASSGASYPARGSTSATVQHGRADPRNRRALGPSGQRGRPRQPSHANVATNVATNVASPLSLAPAEAELQQQPPARAEPAQRDGAAKPSGLANALSMLKSAVNQNRKRADDFSLDSGRKRPKPSDSPPP